MTFDTATSIKVWVTRRALTQGITHETVIPVTAQPCDGGRQYFRSVCDLLYYRLGTDAFLDRQAAIKDAEHRRKQKVAALQKQLKRLKALDFS